MNADYRAALNTVATQYANHMQEIGVGVFPVGINMESEDPYIVYASERPEKPAPPLIYLPHVSRSESPIRSEFFTKYEGSGVLFKDPFNRTVIAIQAIADEAATRVQNMTRPFREVREIMAGGLRGFGEIWASSGNDALIDALVARKICAAVLAFHLKDEDALAEVPVLISKAVEDTNNPYIEVLLDEMLWYKSVLEGRCDTEFNNRVAEEWANACSALPFPTSGLPVRYHAIAISMWTYLEDYKANAADLFERSAQMYGSWDSNSIAALYHLRRAFVCFNRARLDEDDVWGGAELCNSAANSIDAAVWSFAEVSEHTMDLNRLDQFKRDAEGIYKAAEEGRYGDIPPPKDKVAANDPASVDEIDWFGDD